MAQIKVTETVLRDAHQSLIATRMTTEEMLPMLSDLDKVGFHSLECWGGATFDACLRFLNEDPWERLRTIRKACPKTKLQMLFRGQNMLGYRHYADDVVEYFVEKSIDNGIDIMRIFDALNDIRNLETSITPRRNTADMFRAVFHTQQVRCLHWSISPNMPKHWRMPAPIQYVSRTWRVCSRHTAHMTL